MGAIGSIVAKLMLNIENFSSNLSRVQNDVAQTGKKLEGLNNFGSGITKTGATLTKALTVPIVGVGAAAVKTTADFEAGMSKVKAISGATGSDMKQLEAKAKEMGATTKFSAVESAEAFQYMAMAGWDSGQMIDGIGGIMNLAAADGLDLATTSDIVTDALTGFGLQAKDAGHFADVLATASSSANTNVSMLGESFKYVAPVAGALGYSAEDTAIALGLMANSGIKGSQAGTSLRGALTNLVKPTDKAAAMMEQYGISITNQDGSMKSLAEVMDMLRDKMGGLDEATQAQVATQLFGKEAMSGMLAIVNASDKDYNKLTDSINNADGAAQRMADTMLDNLSGQLTLLKSALEGLALEIGEMLMPAIKNIVAKVQEFVTWLGNLSKEQKEQIVRWAGIVAAIGPVMMIVGKLITGFVGMVQMFTKLKGAITIIKTGFVALKAALLGLSAPVLAIVAVVAALVAGFIYLWNTNEDFRNNMIEIWNNIKATIEPILKTIGELLKELWEKVLKPFVEFLLNTLAPVFEGVFQAIGAVVEGFLKVVQGVLDFVIGVFTGDWDRAWNGIKTIFEGIWTAIKGVVEGVWNAIVGFLKAVWDGIGETVTTVFTAIGQFFTNLWTGIQNTATTVWTAISTFFTTIWTGISTFFTNIWTGISTFFTNIVNGIVTFVQTTFGAFFTNIQAIFTGIKDFFLNIWEVIKNLFLGAVLAIIDLVTGDFEQLKTDMANIWNNIKTAFANIWEAIKTIFTNALNAIKNFFSGAMNAIKTVATTVWNAIKSFFTSVLNGIKSVFTNVWNAIKNFFTNAVNNIKNTGVNVFNSLKNGISNVINNIKTTIVNGFNNAINFIKSLPGQALAWGRDIIMGIVNGIKSAIGAVGDAVASVADKIRSFLHFSVPDEGPLTDFETYMPDMIDGFASTLEKAAPKLYNVAKTVAGGLAGAFNNDDMQTAMAGAYGNIVGGVTGSKSQAQAIRESGIGSTIIIENIEVRDDNDIDDITQGLYDKNHKTLRALGRRDKK